MSDSDKLRVYVRIVRLLLEDEDSTQAETYFNRAQLLVHSSNDRETTLQFKLCQARISDYTRKFLEAASRYHELSYVGDIDEDERRHMLYICITSHYCPLTLFPASQLSLVQYSLQQVLTVLVC